MRRESGGSNTEPHDLLLSVAEQLKVPLTIIARQAELEDMNGGMIGGGLSDAAHVHTQAAAALQLVDSYMLGLELLRSQTELELEPVSVSSTLVDTAHHLERFARQHGVELELRIAGRYEPVMAHGRGLRAALLSLGFALAEAVGASEVRKLKVITLATHRSPRGIVAGMYSAEGQGFTAASWRRALQLNGYATQAFTAASAGSGAGFFVADAILRSMQTRLRVGRYDHQPGMSAVFQPSQQLHFV
ncbi:MAG TPA: hypothetical protein VJP80_03145 [Candidatus Saccharimonadales bacterium]|nr:hypothetical protein [Candidatus Saccharimonadales bacterium]